MRYRVTQLRPPDTPSRSRVVVAFATVYVVWGSTYLAIRFAVETLSPFFMAGARFAIAGALLYSLARFRGAPTPERYHWVGAVIVGGLLLFGGNGGLSWAEQRVPSGLASLFVATVPIWVVLLDWSRRGGIRPSVGVAFGVVLGFSGVAVLVGPGQLGSGEVDLVGAFVLMVASLSWAAGSLYAPRARLPSSSLLSTGMEMLAGGAILLLAWLVTGGLLQLDLGEVSLRSFLSFIYLIVFGSIVGFTAFIWLLNVAPPSRVSTYAYVNPVVAVFLGWALGGEPVTPRTLLAAAIIIAAVFVTTARSAEQG